MAIDVSLLDSCAYALAARCEEPRYFARHSAEQKCNIWPACSKEKEISGETYVPHQGSRYKGTADFACAGRGSETVPALPKARATSLRNSHASPDRAQPSNRSCNLTRLTLPGGPSRLIPAQPALRAFQSPNLNLF